MIPRRFTRVALRIAIAGLAFVAIGCSGAETSRAGSADDGENAEVTGSTAIEQTPPAQPTARREEIVGQIVGRSPLGHGACIQESYEIAQPSGDRLWVHFERCGSSGGPDFSGLETGTSYRFTVERGASPNFGAEPMIVDVLPVP